MTTTAVTGADAPLDVRHVQAYGPRHRAVARARTRARARATDAAVLVLVACIALGATVARRPSALAHPELWAEDGAVWFRDAYRSGPWRPLLDAHTGYLQTFPRLVADFGLLVPLRELPLLFAAVAIAVQALPAIVVASHRFATVVPSRAVRLLLVAVYLAVPNSTEVDANLTNAQWHLALLALLCVLATPGGPAWKVFDMGAVVLSGLTGPFVVLLAVLGAWWVWKGPRARWTIALWSSCIVLAAVQLAELLSSPRTVGFAPLGATLPRLVEIVGGQIGLGALFGQSIVVSSLAAPRSLGLATAVFGVFAVVMGWALVRAPLPLKIFLAYSLVVLASSLASPVASKTVPQWQAMAGIPGMRYWFFPTLAFLVSAVWLAARPASALAHRRRADRGRAGRRRSGARTALGLLGALVGVGVLGTAAMGAMPGDWSYTPYAAVGYGRAVTAFEHAHPPQQVDIPIDPPGWTMVLVKR